MPRELLAFESPYRLYLPSHRMRSTSILTAFEERSPMGRPDIKFAGLCDDSECLHQGGCWSGCSSPPGQVAGQRQQNLLRCVGPCAVMPRKQ